MHLNIILLSEETFSHILFNRDGFLNFFISKSVAPQFMPTFGIFMYLISYLFTPEDWLKTHKYIKKVIIHVITCTSTHFI